MKILNFQNLGNAILGILVEILHYSIIQHLEVIILSTSPLTQQIFLMPPTPWTHIFWHAPPPPKKMNGPKENVILESFLINLKKMFINKLEHKFGQQIIG